MWLRMPLKSPRINCALLIDLLMFAFSSSYLLYVYALLGALRQISLFCRVSAYVDCILILLKC